VAKITPQMAARELLRRDRAKESLLDFAKAIDIPGKPVSENEEEWLFSPVETGLAAHHCLMLSLIEQVILGKIPRLMLFMPPGSAKSTMASVVAPTWAMGKFPGTPIILASYGSDLAKKHGRRARQIVRSKEYTSIFGTEISSDTAAADEWELKNGSSYKAGGILSGITGSRAKGLIIDDPVRGREQADSEAFQKKTWEAYQDDLRTRLVPGGWEIIVQTRWSDLDLSGRILPEDYDGQSGPVQCRDGREWYVLSLPAQCERNDDPLGRKVGEYLWPEWFTAEHFDGFKGQPRTWSALFQQRPAPETGTFFNRQWFKRFKAHEIPKDLHNYGSSDFAVSDKGGDFTEHGMSGVCPEGDVWVHDWWYGQETADIWFESMFNLIDAHLPFAWFGEGGVIRKSVEPFLVKRQLERKSWCRLEWLNPVADKPTRARSLQAMAASGKVHILEGEWGDRLIDQLCKFPTGANDDAVDTLATFCMALAQAHPATVAFERKPPPTQAEQDFARITGADVTDLHVSTTGAINIE